MVAEVFRSYRNETRTAANKYDWTIDREPAFIKVYEESPYIARHIIMPKNLHDPHPMANHLEPMFVVEETQAVVSTTTVSSNFTNATLTFRTDQRLMFNATVRDVHGNVRNTSYYSAQDSVVASVYYGSDASNLTLLSQHTLAP